jgi:hypothetical protein
VQIGDNRAAEWVRRSNPVALGLLFSGLAGHYVKKIKGKTCMVGEPSHVKQLSLNHVCKIGLKYKI